MVKQGHVHIINFIRLKYCFALICCRTDIGKWIEVVDIDTVVTDSGLRWLSVLPMLIGPRQAPSRPPPGQWCWWLGGGGGQEFGPGRTGTKCCKATKKADIAACFM